MNSEQAVAHVISCLEEFWIEYMLVGALSCNVYGIPRASADADLVVDLGERDLLDCMSKLGPSHRNVIHFLPTGFDIELFRLSDDPHHQKLRWARRKDLDDIVNVLTVSAHGLDWKYINGWAQQHGSTALLDQLKLEAGI